MIRIYGYSDDLIEIEGNVRNEVSPGRTFLIGDDKRGVKVRMKYGMMKDSAGVWGCSIEQVGEYVPLFPITIDEAEVNGTNTGSYSVRVTIDCPTGTPVRYGKKVLT